MAAPLELDERDPAHLRDTQACQAKTKICPNTARRSPNSTTPPPFYVLHRPTQILWNCLVTEMLVQFLWSGTSTATECDEAMQVVVAAPNATTAVNDTTYLGGTGAGAGAGAGRGCSAGNLKVITMVITGMFAAACLITTAVVCRIAFRLGNRPTQRRWGRRARHSTAWTFNLCFWAGGCWVVVAYGRASRFEALPWKCRATAYHPTPMLARLALRGVPRSGGAPASRGERGGDYTPDLLEAF